MAKNRKTPAVNGKGEKRSSNYSDDTAVRAVFEKFYESLRRIGVTMLKEGQADERARHGRTLVYRTYGRDRVRHILRRVRPSSSRLADLQRIAGGVRLQRRRGGRWHLIPVYCCRRG